MPIVKITGPISQPLVLDRGHSVSITPLSGSCRVQIPGEAVSETLTAAASYGPYSARRDVVMTIDSGVVEYDVDEAGGGSGQSSVSEAPVRTARLAGVLGNDLFYPNDPDIEYGKYVNNTTGATASAGNGNTYNTTGYIPCRAGDNLICNNSVISGRLAYYDKNRAFISGSNDYVTGVRTVPADANIAYIRLSVPVSAWETLKIENSTTQTVYTPYRDRPVVDEYNRHLLLQTKHRLAKLAFGASSQYIICLAGDSYTHGAGRSTTAFASWLASKFGDAGGGWCGFGYLNSGNAAPWTPGNQPSFLNGNARPALYPVKLYGSPTPAYYTEPSIDMASITLLASGDAVEQSFPASPTISAIVLHWIGTGNGSIRYTLNGGATWTTLSVSGTSGTTATTSLSLTGLTQPGTLRIEWVSGTAKLCGVDLQSATNGVRVHKIAATGSNVGSWNTCSSLAGFATAYAAIKPHCWQFMDGPNNQGVSTGGVTAAQWASNLGALMTNIKTLGDAQGVGNGVDRLVFVPPENNRTTNVYPIAGYEAQVRNMAIGLRFALKIVRFGDAGDTAYYSPTGKVPLMSADLLHPDPATGGPLIAGEWLEMIAPRWA